MRRTSGTAAFDAGVRAALTMIPVTILTAVLPGAAMAEDCRDRIAALFEDGGALDPFSRPPHSYVATTYDAGGAVKWIYQARYETALRMIGGTEGGNRILMIGPDTWTGPSPEGPWTAAPNQNPPDMEAFFRAHMAASVKNLDRTDCAGVVEIDGLRLVKFTYVTRTDPAPEAGGAWFGALYTAYIDPDTGRLMRQDTAESVAHYASEPSTDLQVTLYTYDPTITIPTPE
ncbi:hypothetical protein [Sagittula salina]|uniref:Uncharacterized protein n=1 Tax=Sagittula salina TaxID=2820268 RepID=A0A940MRU9_9RHOB|nr:hypothetical protein [Sagittula salina]MBP0483661.1 hypothetical protein [Sagittula salina]